MAEYLNFAILLQARSQMNSDAMRFVMITVGAVMLMVIALVFVYRATRPKPGGLKASLDEEFNKSKDALLLAAQSKKAAKEREEGEKRQMSAEEKERELLRENVDAERLIGSNCPLCGLEMLEDTDLIIDPYTGAGYHLSSFLNDWPVDTERPKYVYRYPQGTVVKSSDLIRSM